VILFFIKVGISVIIILVLMEATTFGWRPSRKNMITLSESEKESAENLKRVVTFLAGEIGLRNYQHDQQLNKAADYIESRFQEIGYETQIMSYEVNGQIFKNIIARPHSIPTKESKDIIVIGAHYDSCFNPGADDNASGVAGTLELARLFKDVNLNTQIQFVAFTNEEPPFFMTEDMGSLVFARKLKKDGQKVRAAIILEMIGYYSENINSQHYLPLLGPFYPNRGNFITVVGNFPSAKVVNTLVAHFRKYSKFPIESLIAPSFIRGVYFSDHWSFWQEGFPAVMVTDTAFLRNKNYHRQTDLPATLDYEKMAVVVHGLKESIMRFIEGD